VSNYGWQECKSGTIPKGLSALKMNRDSGGEISGIAEFSTAMTVLLLAHGTNWNFRYADRNRLLLKFRLLSRDSSVEEDATNCVNVSSCLP